MKKHQNIILRHSLTVLFVVFNLVSIAQNGWIETYNSAKTGIQGREIDSGEFLVSSEIGTNQNRVQLIKVDAAGNEIERHIFGDFVYDFTLQDENVAILLTEDDGILFSAYENEDQPSDSSFTILIKHNSDGSLIWRQRYFSDTNDYVITKIINSTNGYVIGGAERITNQIPYVSKINLSGEREWTYYLEDSLEIEFLETDSNGNVLVISSSYNESNKIFFAHAITANGAVSISSILNFNYDLFEIEIKGILMNDEDRLFFTGNIRATTIPNSNDHVMLAEIVDGVQNIDIIGTYQINGENYSSGHSIIGTEAGGWIIVGATGTSNNESLWKSFYAKVLEGGLLEWTNLEGEYNYGVELNHVSKTADDGFLMVGKSNSVWGHAKVIKTNDQGLIQTNTIAGSIFNDFNNNCVLDDSENALTNLQITLTNTITGEVQNQWASNFEYSFRVDTGHYELTVNHAIQVWVINCDSTLEVNIAEEFTNLEVNIPLQPLFDCPLMTVDLATPIVERCNETDYRIQVINNGTAQAIGAYLELEFDPTISLLESSVPFSTIAAHYYRFQLGTVGASQIRIIELRVDVDCDSTILGQTHCAIANVFPDTLCIEIDPNWDGSVINVQGECLGDSVIFEISNSGAERMGEPRRYIVIEDEVWGRSGQFQLDPGESVFITQTAIGNTIRLETEENPGFLFGGRPSFTIEGCGAETPEDIATGFVNAFPLYDNSPFISIDCQESIIDLNGNLHVAYPTGFEDAHIIREGDILEYFIRFENDQSNPIQNVIVIDSLDEDLDIRTLEIGVTSHPYSVELSDENVLKLMFSNIQLSDIEENNSYGFVKFKIKPKSDLSIGTRIDNSVVILLDSAIVQPDDLFHTLGILVLSVSYNYLLDIKTVIYPNPVEQKAIIKLDGITLSTWSLQIFDTKGSLVRIEHYQGNSGLFDKEEMQTGLYFFKIESKGSLISSGKMVIY